MREKPVASPPRGGGMVVPSTGGGLAGLMSALAPVPLAVRALRGLSHVATAGTLLLVAAA